MTWDEAGPPDEVTRNAKSLRAISGYWGNKYRLKNIKLYKIKLNI